MTAGPAPAAARWPGCWSPTSPASSPAPTPRCCSPTSAPRWSRSRARAATTPAPGSPPVRDGVSTYYLGVNRNKRSVALDLKDADDLAAGPRAGPAGRRARRELQARRPGPLRPRLRHRRRRATPASSTPRSAASAAARAGATLPGYDLIVQAISGLMSLTGDPDGPPYRAGISVFDVMAGLHATIGVLAALQPPARDRARASTSRSTCCPRRCPGWSTRPARYVAGGVVPVPDGQQPPEPVPLRAAALRRRRPDHHRRQRRPVPQAGRGARRARAGRRPAVRAATRTAPPTATSCGRCWSSGCAPGTKMEWFRDIIAAGRAVRADQHHRRGRRVRRGGRARPGRRSSARATPRCPSVRNPITLLRDPGRLPAAAAGARRARRRDPRAGWPSRQPHDERRVTAGRAFPTSLGTSDADQIRLLGQDLAADLMGKVGFGELAFWLVAHAPADARGDPGVRGGAGRAGRPRVHPDRDRRPADLPVRARLAAGRAGRRPARRRLALPRRHRGLRRVPRTTCSPASTATLPDRRRRLGRARARRRAPRPGRPGGSSPASATRCTRSATRARRC